MIAAQRNSLNISSALQYTKSVLDKSIHDIDSGKNEVISQRNNCSKCKVSNLKLFHIYKHSSLGCSVSLYDEGHCAKPVSLQLAHGKSVKEIESTQYQIDYQGLGNRFKLAGRTNNTDKNDSSYDKKQVQNNSPHIMFQRHNNVFMYGDLNDSVLQMDYQVAQKELFPKLPIVISHSLEDLVWVGRDDNTLSPNDFALDLKQRFEQAELPKHMPVMSVLCYSGESYDGRLSICQEISNETGKLVVGGSEGAITTTTSGKILLEKNADWKVFAPDKKDYFIEYPSKR